MEGITDEEKLKLSSKKYTPEEIKERQKIQKRIWQKKKYHSDEEFREKHNEITLKNYYKRKENEKNVTSVC